MSKRRIIAWVGSIAAFMLAGLSGLIFPDQSPIVRVSLVLSVAAVLLNLFAVPFFLAGLKHFKVELRQMYVVLCVGIGIFGLAQVQLPLVNLYSLTFWVDSGAIAIPYLIGVICIFWSMRALSGLLAIKSLWRSGLLALLVVVLISVAIAFLPHVDVTIDELSYDISLALSIWNSVFIMFGAVLAFKIRQKVGAVYEKSMTWLFTSFAILAFAGWHYSVMQLLFTNGDWYYDYSISILPFVAGALALVIAGFTFGSINPSTRTPTVQELVATKLISSLSPAQELKIVLYISNLVSNPSHIKDVIDQARLIASRTQPGYNPLPEDQKAIPGLYTVLENHLLTRDPLRVFTREELRARIAKRFNLSSSVRTTLWSQAIKDQLPVLRQNSRPPRK